MKGKSGKSNRINIKNAVFSLMTTDNDAGTTYGDIEALGAVMQIQVTPGVSKGTLYGNGVKTENISRLNGITVVIDINKAYAEVRSKLLGNKMNDGVVTESAGDEPPYIALGYEVEQTGGKNEYIWLLKGQAQPINSTIQQSTDNIQFSTDSVTIEFIPRESDNALRYYGDAANPDFTAAQAAAWFTHGPSTYPVSIMSGDKI